MYTSNENPASAQAQPTNASANSSAVSWSAVFAGAAATASLSLIFLVLGAGLGLTAISPWAGEGISASTFGWGTIFWLTLMTAVASAFGGYLAGRLRVKWVGVHTHEVFFRDTAHGFLAWALSILVTAALMTTAIAGILSVGAKAGAEAAGGIAAVAQEATDGEANGENRMEYFMETLFRGEGQAEGEAPVAEATRIFVNAVREDELPAEDRRYLAQVITQYTDLSQQEAEQRVNQMFTRLQGLGEEAREAADEARKAATYALMWLFISMLIGAFSASFAATYGGRQRDL